VSQVADPELDLAHLLADPVAQAQATHGAPHPRIARPPQLYGSIRANSLGLTLTDEPTLESIQTGFRAAELGVWHAGEAAGAVTEVTNPADRSRRVGTVVEASTGQLERLLAQAQQAAPPWAALPARQ